MAKNDNLGDFLTDIADAIRAKKGISGSINAQNFASEIASISTGGGESWEELLVAEGVSNTEEDGAYKVKVIKRHY